MKHYIVGLISVIFLICFNIFFSSVSNAQVVDDTDLFLESQLNVNIIGVPILFPALFDSTILTDDTDLFLESTLNIHIIGVPVLFPALFSDVFLTSISPSSATFSTPIALTGTGFDVTGNKIHFKLQGTTVDSGTLTANSSDGTTLSINLPPLGDGTYDVSVETADGSVSNALPIAVGMPTAPVVAFTSTSKGLVSLDLSSGNFTPYSKDLNDTSITKIVGTINRTTKTIDFQIPVTDLVKPGLHKYFLVPGGGTITGNTPFAEVSVTIATPSSPGICSAGFTAINPFSCAKITQSGPKLIDTLPSSTCTGGTIPDLNNPGQCIRGPIADASNPGAGATAPSGNGILAPLVPCDGVKVPSNTDANFRECDFNMLITLAQNIINFLLVFSTAIAASCFFFAGYLYLTAGGNIGQVTRAHHIFKNVAVGLIIALAAWLIVNTVLTALVPATDLVKYNLLDKA